MDRSLPVSAADVRRHHLALVLRTVERAAPISRAAIADRCGLTKSTVSSLIDELLAAGLLADIGPDPSAGTGRPGLRLVLAPDGPLAIGVQIEPDHVAGCVVDLGRGVHRRTVRRADHLAGGVGEVRRGLRSVLRELLLDIESRGGIAVGLGVGVPAVVAPDRSRVLRSPALGWGPTDLAALVAADLGTLGAPQLPVEVLDAGMSAAHATAGTASGVVLLLGGESEISLVVTEDGRPVRSGGTVSPGHLPAGTRGGRGCACGRSGCLVTVAGRESITGTAPGSTRLGSPRRDPAGGSVPPGGDLHSRVRSATRALARVLAITGAAVGAPVVCLDGMFAEAGEPFRRAVAEELDRLGAALDVLLDDRGPDAVMRGAGNRALDIVREDPLGWGAD